MHDITLLFLIIALVVTAIVYYLVAWLFAAVFKRPVNGTLLFVGALILFLLIITGKVTLGF